MAGRLVRELTAKIMKTGNGLNSKAINENM
jgi:hypothetical protein